MLNSYNNILINTYIFIPFIFAFLLGIFSFIKNPIYIRRITKIIFSIIFILAFLIHTSIEDSSFSILKINFIVDNFSSIILFINAFIFLIFSIISKTFIQKSQKLYSLSNLLIFGLINIVILCDNVNITLGSIFWFFLVSFLLNTNFDPKNKNNLNRKLNINILVLAICSILIFYDFARLFILNEIPFNFTNVNENLYHINNSSIFAAFIGLIILISKLFNFIPFNKNETQCNPIIATSNTLTSFILGNIILYKTFLIFDYLFYNFEQYLTLYLIINFVWFTTLSFNQKNLIQITNSTLPIFLIINIFTLFSFEEKGILAYTYSTISTLISFLLLFIVFAILINKSKSGDMENLYKISPKNRILKFFLIIAILNLIKTPPLTLFTSCLINLVMIFSIDYDEILTEITPYILTIGSFLISVCALNIFYKILIEPQNTPKNETKLANHQIITLSLIITVIIIIGIYPQYFFNGSF